MSSAAPSFPSPPRGEELPLDDGEPMETQRHRDQMIILIESLREGCPDWPMFIGGNMFVYFSQTQSRKNEFRGPDLFVVLDVSRSERKSWVAWEEGGRLPDIVIELVSEATAVQDRGEKKELYARVMRVGEYFLFDPFSKELEGFDLNAVTKKYSPKPCNAAGHLACQQLGLELGLCRHGYGDVDTEWLRWYRRDGTLLPLAKERVDE
ncbi:Uma2 family endonuclease, partial [Myxococcota bacterium]